MLDMEKIVVKIQNLFDLANNNPNKNEAIAAAMKAQELMAKYNIEIEQVRNLSQDEEIVKEFISFKKNSGYNIKWRFQLAQVLAKNFKVKTYTVGRDDVVFYGYKTDVKIAASVFNFLFSTGNKLSCKYYYQCKAEGRETVGVINEWLMGFVRGLQDVLERQSAELMIIVPKKVQDEYEVMAKSFGTFSYHVSRSYDKKAYEDGRTEGKMTAQARSIEQAS